MPRIADNKRDPIEELPLPRPAGRQQPMARGQGRASARDSLHIVLAIVYPNGTSVNQTKCPTLWSTYSIK